MSAQHSKMLYPNLPEEFREVVKRARIAQGISQGKMARDLGKSQAVFVSQLESGVRNFTYERAIQFRDYLKLDYELPIPAPDPTQKITRNRTGKPEAIRDKPFYIHLDGRLVEVVVYRDYGLIATAKKVKPRTTNRLKEA